MARTDLLNNGLNVDLSNLSYESIYTLRNDFIKAGGRYGNEFNDTETPLTMYFRPFFYFTNRAIEPTKETGHTGVASGNLLSLDYLEYTEGNETKYCNSAYNFLMRNNELERAEYLKQFIHLLSNISTYSPWYFSKVSGVADAMNHKEMTHKEFKIEDERPKIVIECLPDAFDQRIGTLLDLYKDACYSFTLNKEIVPTNLRKFDMGLFLFSTPIRNMHRYDSTEGKDSWARFGNYHDALGNTRHYMTSCKYLELTNCEIELTSCATAFDTLDNVDGIKPTYKIEISYDRCYETRYNEFLGQIISDVIMYDFDAMRSKEPGLVGKEKQTEYISNEQKRQDMFHNSIIGNAIDQLMSTATNAVGSVVRSVALGNLYDVTSLGKIGDVGQSLASGNVLGAANQIKGMVENGNGQSVAGIGVRTSSGWLRKNIENPDNINDAMKKTSKSFSSNPLQYINMGRDAANSAIDKAVNAVGGPSSEGVQNPQTLAGWHREAIENMRTKVTIKKDDSME